MGKTLSNLDVNAATDVQLKKALTYAIEARKSEIDRFWSRTLVFWGFVAATFVAYGTLFDKVQKDDPTLFAVGCFGFLASVAWSMQSRGSKYWQEAWENKVNIIESRVLGLRLFGNQEPVQKKMIWGARRFSVSRLSIALSDLAWIVWLFLSWRAYTRLVPDPVAPWHAPTTKGWFMEQPNAIGVATAMLTIALLAFCRTSNSS